MITTFLLVVCHLRLIGSCFFIGIFMCRPDEASKRKPSMDTYLDVYEGLCSATKVCDCASFYDHLKVFDKDENFDCGVKYLSFR